MSAAVDNDPGVNALDAARALREGVRLVTAGYQLTPVTITRRPDGKKGARFHENWRQEAAWSGDTDKIRDWSTQYACSFAVRTGHAGGVDVVDMDGEEGILWWSEQGYPLGAMLIDTISDGLHSYVKACGLPTAAKRFAPSVDTRGDGGLVFAPGSFIVGETGTYQVRGDLVSVARLTALPADLVAAIRAAEPESKDHHADGRVTEHDRDWMIERTQAAVQRVAAMALYTDGDEFRDAQMGAAMMLGRLADAGLCGIEGAREVIEEATLKVWPDGLSDSDRKNINSGLADGPRKERWQLRDPFVPASDESEAELLKELGSPDAYLSWTPMDLTAYVNGTVTRPETTVGARRRDGLRFFYPGLEHAVIGETEGGKTWFLLASAAEELITGNRVVYVHFEENDPGGTVSRLLRQFKVPSQRILDDFLFFGPEHPVPAGRIAEICDERVPTLVVLDGQNEAMALHSQKINDPDGAADFRRKLVKPWTRRGAAVAAADHVVKDPGQNGMGYALGSVHKLNGLSGAGFLVENREAFGEGMKGNSGIYVVKDRPGQLRKAGKATAVPRKFHLAEMVIDDTGDMWNLCLHAPSAGDGPDPEFEQIREDRRRAELDDEVFAVAAGLIGKGLDVTASLVAAKVPRGKAIVLETLKRLEADERLVNISYGRAARYDLPNGVITAENEGS